MMETTPGRGQDTTAATGYDPGPVPAVVEPPGPGRVDVVRVSPRTVVQVSTHPGTAHTGLMVVWETGRVLVMLPPQVVDVLIGALVSAAPMAYRITEGGDGR